MKTVSRAAVAAFAITASLLAGCSSNDDADKSPTATATAAADNGVAALEAAAILDKSKAALKAAKSFHVKGAMTDEGSVTEIDLKIAGADVAGTLGFDGAKVELLSVGGSRYIRPNEKFWTMMDSSGQTAKQLGAAVGTKWLKPAASDSTLGAFFGAGDIDELLKATGTLSKGQTKAIEGVPAIGLIDSGDAKSALYIATTGEPYPLKIEGAAPTDALAFSEFGKTFAEIKAPAAAEVVEMPAKK